MSEPTLSLHDRLVYLAADRDQFDADLDVVVGITGSDLATIQREVEDAATATLRAKNSELHSKASGFFLIIQQNNADLMRLRTEHDALKARSDALRSIARTISEGNFQPTQDEASTFDWALDAVDDLLDAADRAGEETPDNEDVELVRWRSGNPTGNQDRDSGEVRAETPGPTVVTLISADEPVHRVIWAARQWHRNWKKRPMLNRDGELFDALEALNVISPDPSPEYPVSQALREDAPSPTDAAWDWDSALRSRPDTERIDDLVTRADAATSRLDIQMRRLDVIAEQIAALNDYYANLASGVVDHEDRLTALQRRHRKLRKRVRDDHQWTRTHARDIATINDRLEAQSPTSQN